LLSFKNRLFLYLVVNGKVVGSMVNLRDFFDLVLSAMMYPMLSALSISFWIFSLFGIVLFQSFALMRWSTWTWWESYSLSADLLMAFRLLCIGRVVLIWELQCSTNEFTSLFSQGLSFLEKD